MIRFMFYRGLIIQHGDAAPRGGWSDSARSALAHGLHSPVIVLHTGGVPRAHPDAAVSSKPPMMTTEEWIEPYYRETVAFAKLINAQPFEASVKDPFKVRVRSSIPWEIWLIDDPVARAASIVAFREARV